MNRYAALLVTVPLLLGCCLGRKGQEERPSVEDSLAALKKARRLAVHDSLSALTDFDEAPGDTSDHGSEEMQDECPLDTSTYKFTTEKLREYQPNISYHWDRWHAEARTVLPDGDTLWLHLGGCEHFGYAAALGTAVPFTDSDALLKKTRWLARTFMDGLGEDYDKMIATGKYHPSYEGSIPGKVQRYEVVAPDTAGYIYDGFSFARKGVRTRIEISGYF
jgi:hypothetical protein